MLIRAVLSWFPIQRDHPILRFVCMVTEPLVAPIRALFDRMGWFRNFPIDLSFLVDNAIGNLVDPPATMVNAAGDYVVSYIVARFVDGKDWLQKKLKKEA